MQLLDVLGGFLRTQALHTVARLGVADVVAEEPVQVEELAARVGADPGALRRSNGGHPQGRTSMPQST